MAAEAPQRRRYRRHPEARAGMPAGIPYIVGNEAAERFSFYGMKAILIVFMTQHMLDASGAKATLDETEATALYHLFTSAVYLTPILGALLADVVFGKFPTIIVLSLVYCAGHAALALDSSNTGLLLGLGLIALGAGGIKPCVSAHLGDQFAETNAGLLARAYGWFYFAINAGAFVSMLLTPWLLANVGPHVAFGVPGVLMFAATGIFWMGRHRFVHIPARGRLFLRELRGREGLRSLGRLALLYVFVAVFWALFDQTGSSWVLQARDLDRHFLGIEWLPSQIQAMNPLLIMLFIPLFTFVVYPAIDRIFSLTPLRKIGIGLFGTTLPFLILAGLEVALDAGQQPSIGWQLLAYVLLTAAEVMVSITCLEFSYTQAPRSLKSFVMALFLMSASIGNLFTSIVNAVIQRPGEPPLLEGAAYFLFFAGLMAAAAALFIPVAQRFRDQRVLQESE
ncbi:MAG: POT family MFS transporter [Myxococcota bacterium]